jgi:hypothetical protein
VLNVGLESCGYVLVVFDFMVEQLCLTILELSLAGRHFGDVTRILTLFGFNGWICLRCGIAINRYERIVTSLVLRSYVLFRIYDFP